MNNQDKLTEQQKQVLALYARSPQDNDGWAFVSPKLFKSIFPFLHREIFQIMESYASGEDKKMYIRATDAGKSIIKFIL